MTPTKILSHLCAASPGVASLRFVALFLLCSAPAYAIGQQRYVEFAPSPGSFRLTVLAKAAPILIDSNDYPGILHAVTSLQADIQRVTNTHTAITRDADPSDTDVVIVGTLGKNRRLDALIESRQLDVAAIRGKWESFLIQVVPHPWPGVQRALIIAGSDKRGTIYGVYDLSEQIGVSPWYWWADVPVTHRDQLFVRAGRFVQGEPAVKYRGIFLNDEAPSLTGWVRATFGNYNHEFYLHVFELLLRLKANFLWPAMWDNAFNDDDPLNPKLADEWGIVMGTSHHEPMMRAQQEWKRYGKGPWDYAVNSDVLRAFWTEGIRRNRNYESIITLAMRGDGDMPMSPQSNVALLERIVADQRKILADNLNPDLSKVPTVWALYKEVQDYYEKGMRVPDDVTLLWSDDNWSNIRRLPTPDERGRSGGAGVYYHFDYVGGPRSYKWVNTVPITKVWEQMDLAYRYGATRIWIVNVGDLKPMEFPIEFFLNFAWDPKSWPAERLAEYGRLWAEREFGAEHAAEIAELIAGYTKYNGRRKPELLEPGTYSLANYREAETIQADYQRLVQHAEALYEAMPAQAKDAFFQLVLYPVKACAVVNEMYIAAARNRVFAVQGRASTNDLAARVRRLFREDEHLSHTYNEDLGGGRWRHMMDQTHIGYTYWNQPIRNAMPGVQEIQVTRAGEMGVAIEGSDASWPDGPGRPSLPPQNVYDQQPVYFEVFNRGGTPITFTARAEEPWLRLSIASGTVALDQRILVSVDWSAAPTGETYGTINVESPQGRKVTLAVPIVNPPSPRSADLQGFVETGGCISIEAEHYSRAIETSAVRWELIPDFGRTLSGVRAAATGAAEPAGVQKTHLEYRVYLFHAGTVSVDAYFAPTQKFQPGEGFRYAVSIDDETPQVINFHAGYSQAEWERSVKDSIRVLTSQHTVAQPGYHTLKFWAVDPWLVLEKLVINSGKPRPSYLGPPESYHLPVRVLRAKSQ